MKSILSLFIFTLLFTITNAQNINPKERMSDTGVVRQGSSEGISPLRLGSEGLNEPKTMQFRELREGFIEDRMQLKEERKEIVHGLFRGISEKFTNAILRLDNIEERLATITENTDQNIEEMINNAKDLKDVAKNSVTELNIAIEEEMGNKEGLSKQTLRELVRKSQIDVKNAWDAFKEVITEIKLSDEE